VLAEKKTASLWEQAGHLTSLVLGKVGSDLTSCATEGWKREIRVRYKRERDGVAGDDRREKVGAESPER